MLRAFGAKIGPTCAVYPSAKIWAPWNLTCADTVAIADGVEVYNPARVELGSHAILSQGAYLCGATHDIHSPAFTLVTKEIKVGAYAWVCARAVVLPGVTLGEGSVLGLASVATRDIPAWHVSGGIPAKQIGTRQRK